MPKPQPYRHVIAEALQPMALEVDTLNQLIGPDDLVAVMTPDMSKM